MISAFYVPLFRRAPTWFRPRAPGGMCNQCLAASDKRIPKGKRRRSIRELTDTYRNIKPPTNTIRGRLPGQRKSGNTFPSTSKIPWNRAPATRPRHKKHVTRLRYAPLNLGLSSLVRPASLPITCYIITEIRRCVLRVIAEIRRLTGTQLSSRTLQTNTTLT